MSAVDTDRSRLEKLLGMLGSSFDGERANAARMIAMMAEKRNMTILKMVMDVLAITTFDFGTIDLDTGPVDVGPMQSVDPMIVDIFADLVADEERWAGVLTAWEWNFVKNIANRYTDDSELSEKQHLAADKILIKIRRSNR